LSRFIPSKDAASPSPKKKETDGPPSKDGNALWRLPEWIKTLPADRMDLLKSYHAELLKFNAKVNLISKNTEREADELHFADCVLASEIVFKYDLPKKVFDIGSGNGFPGLVFGILDQSREYILVESDSRKVEFLKHAINVLKLKNVVALNVRFETLASMSIEAAVSRGFASIAKTLLFSNKIFEKDALFLHLKGSNWSSEIAGLPSQLISVWHPELLGEYSLPGSQSRRAIVITQKR
jgi:16S rRNA (guanine527-N7)-methyltransferase